MGDKKGTLQFWIADGLTEKSRREKKLEPPDGRRWAFETELIAFFDNLIFNEDRNSGNIVYDKNWKVWMIDHTRAFRRFDELKKAASIRYCEQGVWEKLQTLDDELIEDRLQEFLNDAEIRALLSRRKELVSHLQEQIKKRGEAPVLWAFEELDE